MKKMTLERDGKKLGEMKTCKFKTTLESSVLLDEILNRVFVHFQHFKNIIQACQILAVGVFLSGILFLSFPISPFRFPHLFSCFWLFPLFRSSLFLPPLWFSLFPSIFQFSCLLFSFAFLFLHLLKFIWGSVPYDFTILKSARFYKFIVLSWKSWATQFGRCENKRYKSHLSQRWL